MKGRKPIPTSLKVLKGTDRPCRINDDEPKPGRDRIRMPSTLSDGAKKHWRQVCKELKSAGVMTNLDITALAMYCEAYAMWIDAQDKLQRFGPVIKNDRGYPVMSPYFKIAERSFAQLKSMLVEFGMSPSSRTRVSVNSEEQAKEDDPFARLSAIK